MGWKQNLAAHGFRTVGRGIADPLRAHINPRLSARCRHCCRRNPLATDIPRRFGYAGFMRFDADALALLADVEEIEIETATAAGASHRTIIWVVVEGDDAFVRSVNGSTARWYREAVETGDVTIRADGRALPARVVAAPDAASVERVNTALRAKYTGITGLPEMLEPDTFSTTLRLEPA